MITMRVAPVLGRLASMSLWVLVIKRYNRKVRTLCEGLVTTKRLLEDCGYLSGESWSLKFAVMSFIRYANVWNFVWYYRKSMQKSMGRDF